jgi:hypothetical protein
VIEDAKLTASEIVSLLERISDNTGGDTPASKYRYVRGNLVVTAGTQDITGDAVGPPQGFAWQVLRIVVSVESAATAQCEFRAYLDQVNPPQLVETLRIGAGNDIALAGPTGNTIYVPPASVLIPRFLFCNIGSDCAFSICVREFGIE